MRIAAYFVFLASVAISGCTATEPVPMATWIQGAVQVKTPDYRSFDGFTGVLACAPSPADAIANRQAVAMESRGAGRRMVLTSDWYNGVALVADEKAIRDCGFEAAPL